MKSFWRKTGTEMVFLLFLFYPLVISLTTQSTKRVLENVYCRPHADYVSTSTLFAHTPYVVRLDRCHGKGIPGPLFKCVPKTVQNVSVLVVLTENGQARRGNISMINHTSCEERCVHSAKSCNKYEAWEESTCSCLCKQKSPPADCTAPFYWHQAVCSCRCPRTAQNYLCDTRKEFNKEACGCMCKAKWGRKCKRIHKFLNETTCGCAVVIKTDTIKLEECSNRRGKIILIIVTVLEAVAILTLFYLCNQYSELFKKYCCSKNPKTIKFDNDMGNNNAATDNISIDTPTIDLQPDLNNSQNTLRKPQNNINETKKTVENHQPFLFSDSLSRKNKYRYEMSNIVPLFYQDDEKSYPTRKNTNSSVSYNDVVDATSDKTFTLSDSLASVTQV